MYERVQFREQHLYQRKVKSWFEDNYGEWLDKIELEQGRLARQCELSYFPERKLPSNFIVAYQKRLFCQNLALTIKDRSKDPFAKKTVETYWEPEWKIFTAFPLESWDILTTEARAKRRTPPSSDDDDVVSDAETEMLILSTDEEEEPFRSCNRPGALLTPEPSFSTLNPPSPNSRSELEELSLSAEYQPEEGISVARQDPRQDREGDSGEEGDQEIGRRREEASSKPMSEKRRGKQRAMALMGLLTPQSSIRLTPVKSVKPELGQIRIDSIKQVDADLRGKAIRRKGKGKTAPRALTNCLLTERIRQIAPNPDSELVLRDHFSSMVATATRKTCYHLENFRVTSSTGVLELLDLFTLRSGYEICGEATLALKEGDDGAASDAGSLENSNDHSDIPFRKVCLYSQDRPKLCFTLQDGFVIETRISRFILRSPEASYKPATRSAARLLNVWAFARNARIRGNYSDEQDEVDKVAKLVRDGLETLKNSGARLPEWQRKIPCDWRYPLHRLTLKIEHERVLFENLPNIPFVVPDVYKLVSPHILPNSLRTHGLAVEHDADEQSERHRDFEMLNGLLRKVQAWKDYQDDFEIAARGFEQRLFHPDSPTDRIPVKHYARIKINSFTYRKGDVVLVLPENSNESIAQRSAFDDFTDDDPSDEEDAQSRSARNRHLPPDARRNPTEMLWFARVESIFRERARSTQGSKGPRNDTDDNSWLHVTYFTMGSTIPSIGPYFPLRQLFLLDKCTTIAASSIVCKVEYRQLEPGEAKPATGFYGSSLYSEEDGSIQDITTPHFDYCRKAKLADCGSCETDLIYTEATSEAPSAEEPADARGQVGSKQIWTPIHLEGDHAGTFRYAGKIYHPRDFILLSPETSTLSTGTTPSDSRSAGRRVPLRLAQLVSIEPEQQTPQAQRLAGVHDLGKLSRITVRWVIRRTETDKASSGTQYEREVFLTDTIIDGIDCNRLEGHFNLNHLVTVRKITRIDSDIEAIAKYERDNPLNFFYTSRITRADRTPIRLSPIDESLSVAAADLVETVVGPSALESCTLCTAKEHAAIESRHRIETELGKKTKQSRPVIKSLSLYSGGGGLDLGLGIGCKALETKQAVEINEEAASVFRYGSMHQPSSARSLTDLQLCSANQESDNVAVSAVSDYVEDVLYGRRQRAFFAFISAGAPCQGFSFANLYKRADDLRCLEPFVFLTALAMFRPLYAIFENVQGFLGHSLPSEGSERGSFFQLFLTVAISLGYQVRWSLVNAAGYGVAQGRRRLIVQLALSGVPLPNCPAPTHAYHNASLAFNHTLRETGWVKTKLDRTSSCFAPNPPPTIAESIDDLPAFSIRDLKQGPEGPVALRPFGFAWNSERGSQAKYRSEPRTSFQLQSRAHPRLGSSTQAVVCRQATHHICASPPEMYYERLVNLGVKGKAGKKGNYLDLQGLQSAPTVPDWLMRPEARTKRDLFWSRLSADSIVSTLRTRMSIDGASHGPRIHWDQARWLSLRELMRIQGLPDAFEMIIPDADPDAALTDMIRIIGNGVPVPMAEAKGRGTISQSKPEDYSGAENLHVHYCLCGEFILVVDAPLASLPRRPADKSFALVNQGADKRVYKLNVSESNSSLVKPQAAGTGQTSGDMLSGGGVGAAGKEGNGVLALRDGQFEYQRRLYCTRCQLQIGYETVPGESKGVATFILPGALTDVQNKVPEEAFGEGSL
ncbi:uncharacterized protein JCM15063_000072 [Sporobolomyces koalae]|uniref:uncharacterized protein n=1 Tax=Sporobolomyces koalae TaxID=500713 RepID=UPI003180F00C